MVWRSFGIAVFSAKRSRILAKRSKTLISRQPFRAPSLGLSCQKLSRGARGGGAILYTDCDVFFTAEVVSELEANPCRYFAVAPEAVQDDYVNMNTGVMLLNCDRLGETLPEFRAYILENLVELEKESWDEAAYRWFYRDINGPLWDRLRPELNWKPYWGDNVEARIIHLHGPKPYQRDHIDTTWPELRPYTIGAYGQVADLWGQLLQEARNT